MRKIFYFLLLCVSWGHAQEFAANEGEAIPREYVKNTAFKNLLLKKEDFTLCEGRMQVTAFPCQIKNEDNTHTILVSVVCQQKVFDQLGVDKINDMILVANEKVRHSLNLSHRYLPKEIRMAYFPDSRDWSLTNSFTEQDVEGTETEHLLAVDFDANGKFALMKRIL